jgi:Coenzyme PQQ synthesis protein D (PqqD)
MNNAHRFCFNEPRVISEVLDGELIVIHFETGCYYSIQGVGADVCKLLAAGHSLADIAQKVAEHLGANAAQIGPDIQKFVRQLLDEQLVVSASSDVPTKPVELTAQAYTIPCFEKFDDMAEQLLLDPIHEIGETGWPVQRSVQ